MPKTLARRGLEDGTQRLRGELRDAAQGGQRDGYGGDQIEDAAAAGAQRAMRGAANLLKKGKTNHTEGSKGQTPPSDSPSPEAAPEVAPASPAPQANRDVAPVDPAPTAPKNTDRPRIKTREYTESVPTENAGVSPARPRQRTAGSAGPKVREDCMPIKTREAVEPARAVPARSERGRAPAAPAQQSAGTPISAGGV